MAVESSPAPGRTPGVGLFFDKAVFYVGKHWLALANLMLALYVGLPLLAPVFMDAGWTTPARIIYTVYRPACHQRPERSFFVGGPQVIYTPEDLNAAGVQTGLLSRDIGNDSIGWKVAFCERDVAIYGSMLLTGLAFGLIRRRPRRYMSLKVFALFLVPMAVDGGLQFVGLHESTWWLRTITGVIFGVGAVLFAYPRLEDAFAEMRHSVNRRLHLEPDSPR